MDISFRAFSAETYAQRRTQLLDQLGPRAVVFVRPSPETLRNGDSGHAYRANSDSLYLTGFSEPDATVVLSSASAPKFRLYVRPSDPEREQWDGRRAGIDGAKSEYGADAAYGYLELAAQLEQIIDGAESVWLSLGSDPTFDAELIRAMISLRRREGRGARAPRKLCDLRDALGELRLHKSADELALLRTAAEITVAGHMAAIAAARPGAYEFQLQAAIEREFRMRGASSPGYTTIVGCGANATTLHYIENSAPLVGGDLVLVDAGAEYRGYTGDVTRTFPCGGRFSEPQRQLYDLVLHAQREAISRVRPGNSIQMIHDGVCRTLTEGLLSLGLLQGNLQELIENKAFRRYYMHGTSHWLGLDVHDSGRYRIAAADPETEWLSRPLEPGMVLTIEPGLYVGAKDQLAPERYRTIGIRIEDDVVVTDGEPEVLTSGAPTEPEVLEELTTRALIGAA